MKNYQDLVDTVIVEHRNHLKSYANSLELIGKGRSAYVFKLKMADIAIKVFFPEFIDIAKEEAEIYHTIKGIPYYPALYDTGPNYIVMEYIHGHTMFECLSNGREITLSHIKEIDEVLNITEKLGLNPSDIHLRNIMITNNNEIKLIDVARFRQTKHCNQWDDLKKAYHQFYGKGFFLKRIPAALLNLIAFLYKRSLIPNYRVGITAKAD